MNKIVINNYITSINDRNIGEIITDEEYLHICEALKNKPTKEGYYFKLKNDTLAWDMFKIPEAEKEQAEKETEIIGDE